MGTAMRSENIGCSHSETSYLPNLKTGIVSSSETLWCSKDLEDLGWKAVESPAFSTRDALRGQVNRDPKDSENRISTELPGLSSRRRKRGAQRLNSDCRWVPETSWSHERIHRRHEERNDFLLNRRIDIYETLSLPETDAYSPTQERAGAPGEEVHQCPSDRFSKCIHGSPLALVQPLRELTFLLLMFRMTSGWWFQTFFYFPFHIWDNPSHWRTHIFQDG